MHATVQAVLPAPLFYWPLQGDLQRILSSSNHAELQIITTYISIPASSGGTGLVTGEADPLEWQGTVAPTGDNDHQVRCIPPGLGSSVQQHQDRGSGSLHGTSQSGRYT